MKKQLYTSLFLALFSVKSFGNTNPVSSTNEEFDKAPKVLVIGFEKEKLESNYYGTLHLSEHMGISEDSVHAYLYGSIYNQLANYRRIRFNELRDKKLQAAFYNHVTYNVAENRHNIDLSGMELKVYQSLLDHNQSDFVLFISRYQLNWSGEPFNTNLHLVEYTLFDREMNNMFSGRLYFDSADISAFQREKRAQRKALQMAQSVEKAMK